MRDFKPLISVDEGIDARPSEVWDTATHKTGIMFMGADVKTDWHEGHAITFSGEWKGKAYEDKGVGSVVRAGQKTGVHALQRILRERGFTGKLQSRFDRAGA